jgi:hypothetical protein
MLRLLLLLFDAAIVVMKNVEQARERFHFAVIGLAVLSFFLFFLCSMIIISKVSCKFKIFEYKL